MRATGATLVRRRGLAIVLASALAAACAGGPPDPAAVDTRNDRCRFCHMAVSDARTAGQIVAPGEEPVFFDDLGCLASYLGAGTALPAGAVAYVADHRMKEWVRATNAVYTRVPGLQTPMSSHLIAHRDASSRDADPDASGGADLSVREVFGPSGPPGGSEDERRATR
jgi:copper chaperone NosL